MDAVSPTIDAGLADSDDERLEAEVRQFLVGQGVGETASELFDEDSSESLADRVGKAYAEGRLEEYVYQNVIAKLMSLNWIESIEPDEVNEEFVGLIPIAYARRFRILALRGDGPAVTIAKADTQQLSILSHVAAMLRVPVVMALAPSAVIDNAINIAYTDRDADFDEVLDDAHGAADSPDDIVIAGDGDLLDTASRAPVIKLVNLLLFEAVKKRASDVHLQPTSNGVQVRYRIDGVLLDFLEVPPNLLDEVVSRIKVIGRMDIAEKRIAQDGRTTVFVGDRSIDLRISVVPTSHGERVVLRLLDKSARLYDLAELGMAPKPRAQFTGLLERTHGIILVTGPTGSGKSTTLYASLQHMDASERNILTLEDPIEYQLDGISQTQVNTKKGMTFSNGLRAVLRQDPDVIMVGEIRDEATARMAVQSSLTGHLVFSTLHTNDAAGALSRLLDLSIEPYLVASSLLAVLAQRLVRVVCSQCCERIPLCSEEIEALGLDGSEGPLVVNRAVGCSACGMSGYYGRQGIFELLSVDEAIREMIMHRDKASAIKHQAVRGGMATLRQDAVRRMLAGETTLDEVSRVTFQDELIAEPQETADGSTVESFGS